jgi:hypothetical protein
VSEPTPGDPHFSWGLIIDVFDVLEQHGYRRGTDSDVGLAVVLVRKLAVTYNGTAGVTP